MDQALIKVLLVDDDEDDYILTRDLLQEHRRLPITLDWLDNYEQALAAIAQNQHDVYLLDYRLGERSGLDLLRQALSLGCHAPMILLTGQGDYEIDLEAMKAGAADFLDKSQLAAPLLERSIRYALERKQAEQKILEQAALLDIATDAIMVRDLNRRILVWNQGAERLYGWQLEEAIGQDAEQLLGHQSSNLGAEAELLATGEWQGELRQKTKAGKEVIVASRWALVRDPQSLPKSILIVNTDITEKKQLEAQFLRTQRLESIGTLAGGIAHDLNNILAPVLMTVQLLRLKVMDEQSHHWLTTLETNIKRGAELVKQVLSFSRGVEGEHRILQIGHLLLEIEQLVRETFPKSIEMETNIPIHELWPLSGDPTQLQQVLMNLCVNARDAMPEGGKLQITAKNFVLDRHYARTHLEARTGAYVLVEVADSGVGIAPEIVDRIFEPFFTTKEIGKGTGLGLSTVMGIVKSHRGFVTVYSELNRGTQFRVYLPAIATAELEQQLQEYPDLPVGHQELILVVDDEELIRTVTKTSLETYGYMVLVAGHGTEAIALYQRYQQQQPGEIRAIVLDMMMPGLEGMEIIQAIAQINPQAKIIATSGLAANQQTAQNASPCVKAFLSKPYGAAELLKTLHRVLYETI